MQTDKKPDCGKIKSLLDKTKPIVAENKRIREEREANGDFFNIFSILGMEHYEVNTHSAFLAELLNPKGSHGKKDTYLRLFVDTMPLQGIDKAALDTSDAKVLTEEPTEEGRLDIMIGFPASKYIIIIENKIYAGDQEKQLERYRRHAEKAYRGFTLLYLTLDGHEPSEWSTGEKPEKPYWTSISYAKNIRQWLEKCIGNGEANKVTETIRQYIALIDKLTGQEMEDKMSEKLTKLMTDNLDETLAILDNREAFDAEVYGKFIEQMKDLAKELDCDFECDGDFGFWGATWQYICFVPKNHPKCKAGVVRDYGVWWYLEKENIEAMQKKLTCFAYEPQKGYPYGYGSFEYDKWNTATIRAICNGELKEYMRKCIQAILDDPNFPK